MAAVSRMTPGYVLLCWAAAAAIITTVAVLLMIRHEHQVSERGPGELRSIRVASLADGRPILVVAALVMHSNNSRSAGGKWTDARIEVFDLVDGRRRAAAMVEHPTYCSSAGPGLLWCNTNYRSNTDLELRDAATLAVRVPNRKLVASAPPLALHESASIDARTREAWIMTSDARYWHVDPLTLNGSIAEDASALDAIAVGPNRSPLTGDFDIKPNGFSFQGEPKRIERDDHDGHSQPIGSSTFVNPQFIMDTANLRAPLMIDGDVIFVADRTGKALVITAQGLDGHMRWAATLDRGEISAAWIIDHRLVLGIANSKQGVIVAIDVANGSVLWHAGV
jgi:hypothetical protein